ncbi:hypothetical protein GEMRC1_001375 [Eukaryota sp. GEM-RC1]
MATSPCCKCVSVGHNGVEVACGQHVCTHEGFPHYSSPDLSTLDSLSNCADFPLLPIPSHKPIWLQQSIIVLIHSYLLRRRLKICFTSDGQYRDDRSLGAILYKIPPFIEHVGHVSLRFLDCAYHAVQHFLERSTVHLLSTKGLLPLASFSSFFKADVKSVSLREADPLFITHECDMNYLHCISGISTEVDLVRETIDHYRHLSFQHFSALKKVSVVVNSQRGFDLFCKSLRNLQTIEELSVRLRIGFISKHDLKYLGKVCSSVTNLKTLKMSLHYREDPRPADDSCGSEFDKYEPRELLRDEDLTKLFTVLGDSSIQSLDLLDFVDYEFNFLNWTTRRSVVLIPLFNSYSIKSLIVPRHSKLDSTVIEALKNSLTIEEITLYLNYDLCDVLEFNKTLKKLKIFQGSASLSPIFKSLGKNTSLLELEIIQDVRRRASFDDQALSLNEMLQVNSTLLVLKIDGLFGNSSQFQTFLDVLQLNSGLQTVSFHNLNLSCLTLVFKAMSTNTLHPLTNVSPHSVDFTLKTIHYDASIKESDLLSLLEALESNVHIKRVECRAVARELSLEGLIALYKILSINKSLIDIDISPHFIDIENRLFSYLPRPRRLDTGHISTLQVFVESCGVKKLVLNRCEFCEESRTAMCDFIKETTSLTSIEFKNCMLSDYAVSRLIDAGQSNCSLEVSFQGTIRWRGF